MTPTGMLDTTDSVPAALHAARGTGGHVLDPRYITAAPDCTRCGRTIFATAVGPVCLVCGPTADDGTPDSECEVEPHPVVSPAPMPWEAPFDAEHDALVIERVESDREWFLALDAAAIEVPLPCDVCGGEGHVFNEGRRRYQLCDGCGGTCFDRPVFVPVEFAS